LEIEFGFLKALAAGDTLTMPWRSLRASRARS
ncbi:acyl dehydratase, partial [Burkholderia pseudomallei]